MSRALGRLRDLQNDPLLVRTRSGYALTPHAQAIQPLLGSALRGLRDLFRRETFDPAIERRVVRLAASDAQTVLLLPGVMARLAREAPGIDLRVEGLFGRPAGPPSTAERWTSPSPCRARRCRRGPIARSWARTSWPWCCGGVIRPPAGAGRWRITGRISMSAWRCSATASRRSTRSWRPRGVSRRIALVTPHFMAALAAGRGHRTWSRRLSAALARRFAEPLGLVLLDTPLPETRLCPDPRQLPTSALPTRSWPGCAPSSARWRGRYHP